VDDRNLTIRTSIVGPELKTDGIGLFHWFMSQRNEVEGYEKVIWSGVTTLQLAKAIGEDARNPQTGLYHLVNNEVISKYDLLCLFNQYCRQNKVTVQSNTSVSSDKSLVDTRMANAWTVPSYEQMIRDMAEWMRKHPQLYRQYEEG
jgi:dTDP-4-dehydrorhamnose reductase